LSRADRGQSESMDVDQLLTLRPMLQRDHLGQPAYWAVAEDVAKLLDQIVSPGCRTLETGAGVSTVIFALKGAHHTCVVPDAKLVERIIAFCRDAEINTEKLRFEVAPSQDILPRLSLIDLDVVLIDGAHAFPIPFLDWFYAARTGLREGGTLIIDDVQLWTGRLLTDFLRSEPSWRLTHELVKSAVFQRTGDAFLGDWTAQPLVVYDGDLETSIRMKQSVIDLRKVIPDGLSFIAVDEDQLMLQNLGMLEQRRALPFPESDGRYAGKPPDDATAVRDLERLRGAGAAFLVIFWPAFWWLEHYRGFAQYVDHRFARTVSGRDLMVFDLRTVLPASSDGDNGVGGKDS